MRKKSNKKGEILTENIIFLILNLVFLSILAIFLFSRTASAAVLEERYAKQIALALDAAESGMIIHLEMGDALKMAEKNSINFGTIVTIRENIVTVRLRDGAGYSYSFFNNAQITARFDTESEEKYYFVIE
ncbi:hypothetical protein FJZ20_00170 [Candidatus Pacearchaeota archaeon]|nr:hypothetical protein [Candidatus Pacearchaeota archaeon]